MQILPIKTPVLEQGDNLASILLGNATFEDGDIIVVSSKAIATVEGAAINLEDIKVSKEAERFSEELGRSAAFRQAVLNETKRMNGRVLTSNTGILLTELQPEGLQQGTILVPNAGLDESNVEHGYAIGWPVDPVASARTLREALGSKVAIIITDSGCSPRRRGVTAFALTVAGIDPIQSLCGRPDLFGRTLRITEEAVADQIATAANIAMGNDDQCAPAAIVRDHGFSLSDTEMWVPGICREDDMYFGTI